MNNCTVIVKLQTCVFATDRTKNPIVIELWFESARIEPSSSLIEPMCSIATYSRKLGSETTRLLLVVPLEHMNWTCLYGVILWSIRVQTNTHKSRNEDLCSSNFRHKLWGEHFRKTLCWTQKQMKSIGYIHSAKMPTACKLQKHCWTLTKINEIEWGFVRKMPTSKYKTKTTQTITKIKF